MRVACRKRQATDSTVQLMGDPLWGFVSQFG
jgi:hypothetical protein